MSDKVKEPELPPLGHRKRPLSIIEEDDDSAGSQETLEKENREVNKEGPQDGCTRTPSFKALKQFFIDKTESHENKNGTGVGHNKKVDTKKTPGAHVSSHITKPTKSKPTTDSTPPNKPTKPSPVFTKSVRIPPKIQSAIKSATTTSGKQRESTQKPTPTAKPVNKPKTSTTPSREQNGKNTTSTTTTATTTTTAAGKRNKTTPVQSKATKPNGVSGNKSMKKPVTKHESPSRQPKSSESDPTKKDNPTIDSTVDSSNLQSLENLNCEDLVNVDGSLPSDEHSSGDHCLEASPDAESRSGLEAPSNSKGSDLDQAVEIAQSVSSHCLKEVHFYLNDGNVDTSDLADLSKSSSSSSLSLSTSKTSIDDDDSVSPSNHLACPVPTSPGPPDCQDSPPVSVSTLENSPSTQTTLNGSSQNSQIINGNSPISDQNTSSNECPQISISLSLSTTPTTTTSSLLSSSSISHHSFSNPKLITKFRHSPTLSRKYSIERNQTSSLNGKLTLASIPRISSSTSSSFTSLSLPRDISKDYSPTDSNTDEYGFLLDKSRLSAPPGSPLLGSRYRPARRGSYFFTRKQSTDSLNSLSENDTLENSDDPLPISAADLNRLKETADKMHLSTRRASVLNWRQNYLDDTGLRKMAPVLDSGGATDENLTLERKQRIDDALEWLRCELQEMRSQDQALARQLLTIRQDINELKLQRCTQEHQNLLDDYKSDLEELQEFSDVLDLPYPIFEDNRLKHIGITRHNMSARRFSTC